MSDNLKLCYTCRLLRGFARADEGSHTAIVCECIECKKVAGILPGRHWRKINDKLTSP